MKAIIKIISLSLMLILLSNAVLALDFNSTLTSNDKSNLDSMLQPITKIYDLIKYVSTAIAAIMLLISGINYIISGEDKTKRDQAKNIAAYVVIGLAVIWATPYFLQYFA